MIGYKRESCLGVDGKESEEKRYGYGIIHVDSLAMEEYCSQRGERRVGGGGRTEECAQLLFLVHRGGKEVESGFGCLLWLIQMSGGCASGGSPLVCAHVCSQKY